MDLNFEPPGPVGAAFMGSHKLVNGLMGPVGSGKTSCLMMKTIFNAARQPQSKVDGVRYSKALFVRETFRQLYGTTIPSWWQWMPKDAGHWKGGGNEAAQHHLRFQLPDSSIVDLQCLFEALGDQSVETLMRGKEFNLFNGNEVDTLHPDVLPQAIIRISQGRYPGERHVDPEQCVIEANVDYNAPDIENYMYRLMEESRPSHYGFFRQPGGLDAAAENRKRATLAMYQAMEADLIAQGREDLSRRMIHNQYGFTRDGKPVFPEYRDDFHCAREPIKPVKGLPIRISVDQGLHAAAVLRQTMPNGQRVILDEIRVEGGAPALAEGLQQMRGEKYQGFSFIGGQSDPAGAARSSNDLEPWLDCFNRLMNFRGSDRITIAGTNDIEKRLSAVSYFLRRTVDAARPGLIISPTCRMLRKGFASHYRFKNVIGKRGEYQPKPEKNMYADLHDALQYDCLDGGGFEAVTGLRERGRSWGGGKIFRARMEVNL